MGQIVLNNVHVETKLSGFSCTVAKKKKKKKKKKGNLSMLSNDQLPDFVFPHALFFGGDIYDADTVWF